MKKIIVLRVSYNPLRWITVTRWVHGREQVGTQRVTRVYRAQLFMYTHFVSHALEWFPRQPCDSSVSNRAEGITVHSCLHLFSSWYCSCILTVLNDKPDRSFDYNFRYERVSLVRHDIFHWLYFCVGKDTQKIVARIVSGIYNKASQFTIDWLYHCFYNTIPKLSICKKKRFEIKLFSQKKFLKVPSVFHPRNLKLLFTHTHTHTIFAIKINLSWSLEQRLI